MAKIGFLLLSGGRSSRMGTPKALLEVNGRTLLDTVAQAGTGFEEKILSVNDLSIKTPDGFLRVGDVYPGCGPMAGVHAALLASKCEALVTAPCDLPHYSRELAQYLAEQYEPELDALVLRDGTGRMHPLCGVYAKRCLPVLEAHLSTGRFKIMRMLEHVRMKMITLPAYFSDSVFENLNTPEDLAVFGSRREKSSKDMA